MDHDEQIVPRDDSEPDRPGQRLIFSLSLVQEALDYLIGKYGCLPGDDIRLTVARELSQQSTLWIDSIVRDVALRTLATN